MRESRLDAIPQLRPIGSSIQHSTPEPSLQQPTDDQNPAASKLLSSSPRVDLYLCFGRCSQLIRSDWSSLVSPRESPAQVPFPHHLTNKTMAQQDSNSHAESPTCSIEDFTHISFDYIICGGGTAGCAIAARLSENPDVTVGIVEAGKYRIGDPLVDTPTAFFGMFENPEYDWCLYTAPQAGTLAQTIFSFADYL